VHPLWFLRRVGTACTTSARRWLRATHRSRWSHEQSLYAGWNERAEVVASLIPPAATVLDLGAGRGALAGHLPAGCRYLEADLVPRNAATLVCDLNANPLPVLPPHDVAVLAGVLEYLHEPERLLRELARMGSQVVASYALAVPGARSWLARRSQGWFNDFTSEELSELYRGAGFRVAEETVWRGQRIARLLPDGRALPADERGT